MKNFYSLPSRWRVVGAALPARAADLARAATTARLPYVAPIYYWTGFYIGGHVGGAFSSDNNFLRSRDRQ